MYLWVVFFTVRDIITSRITIFWQREREMKKVGIVLALAVELENVLNALGSVEKVEDVGAYEVYFVLHGRHQLYLAVSGVGEIAASATTQMLITKYNVDAIVNFGFVGALDDTLECQQVVAVKDMVHYDFDISAIDNVSVGRYPEFAESFIPCDADLLQKAVNAYSGLQQVRIASGDKFIADSQKKRWLIEAFHADICDMESAGIILTATRNNVPVMCLKVISDNANEKSPITFYEIVYNGSKKCAGIIAKVLDVI